MKSTGLLSLLTFSDKRQETLFFLEEGAKTLSEIKDHFRVKTPEILPRLKEMEASGLIIKAEGNYHLSKLGEVVAAKYRPFLDTLKAIEVNQNFWNNHNLSAIPDHLIHRIDELKGCTVIEAADCDLCESHKPFVKNVSRASHVYGAACIFIHGWIDMFTELANNGVPIELIVSKGVYEKLEREYHSELLNLLNQGAKIYICNQLSASFAVTEDFFSLSLNYINGPHDTKYDLEGKDLGSVTWGEALFEYYLENSTQVKMAESLHETIMRKIYPQSLLV